MNLVIDFGNTRIKAAFFEENDLVELYENLEEIELIHLIRERKPDACIISSVRKDIDQFQKKIEILTKTFVLNHQTALPIQNKYATPHTLGVDRLAAAVGANTLFPNKNCLVIDLGTCITLDWIDEKGHFRGGNISPGLRMRLKAMHHFTGKLPLIENLETENITLIGNSTQQAMLNGAINGVAWEIEGFIRNHQATLEDFVTILCGGDAIFFETKIKEQIFASPNLTLVGLNRILQYNVERI